MLKKLICNTLKKILLIGYLIFISSCSSGKGPSLSQIEPIYDPYEGWNRAVFDLNIFLDDYALSHAANAYNTVTPKLFRILIQNELDYMQLPISFINASLQGDIDVAGNIAGRFFVNGFFGGLGLLDPATEIGLPAHTEDFGQTLAVWGINDGRYYMAPIFGPLTLRDVGGRVVDFFLNPLSHFSNQFWAFNVAERALNVVEFRSSNTDNINNLKNSTQDYYAAIRSIYLQKRNGAILNDDLNPVDDFVDFNMDE